MADYNNYHEEEVLGKAYDSRLMRRLLSYVRPYRWQLGLAVFLLVSGSLLQLLLPVMIQIGIDKYLVTKDLSGLPRVALAYAGILVAVFLLQYVQMYITMFIGQKVQYDIRMQIFKHLQKLHLGFFDKNPVGRLVTRVTNDVNVLDEMFSSGLVSVFGDIITLAGIVAALLYYNWKLALLTLIVLPLLVLATAVFRKKVRDIYRQIRLKLARLNSFVQEHVTGMTVIQLFTRENATFEKFSSINSDLRSAHLKSIYYYAVFFPVVEIISALSMAILIYYGGIQINSEMLTFGELVAFIQLVQRFYNPIRDLAEKYNILQSSMASSERIFKLLDTKPEFAEEGNGTRPKEFKGKIEFENVTFAYNSGEDVLRDVSFTVEPGEKVAIVGATGAGKTSLVSLLFRFYDYQKGSIKLDGVELKDMSSSTIRSQLGLVLQDVFIFSGDYAGNIRLGSDDITDDQLIDALKKVNLYNFIVKQEGGLGAEVKERGATLSTGQKQLLSFARALAFNPNILVLDEATSSVDTATERMIQKALDKLLENRTAIIIAHRLSTIEKADKIIVLHHGRLREMGKHHELLEKKGIYYRLYQMQFKRDEIKAAR
ncbi:MAG: antibiotic ABC transporter ATP-binding protein [candidate division Zixibacteria bacterium HGW-Zixibacteria-1]|nr:MAG: antibiotic ABC transporter ATP-binding protein [candidate division Zixibacteria bacterium HGW-Zixibacteria-1]